MDSKEESVANKLREMRKDYARNLPGKFESIAGQWETLKKGGGDHQLLCDLHREVHSLAGSGSTFGFPLVSQLARSSEILLKARTKEAERVTPDFIEQVDELLVELGSVARNPGEPQDLAVSSLGNPTEEHNNRLLIVDSDAEILEKLASQLSHYGYQVSVVKQTDFTPQILDEYQPAILIADTDVIGTWGEDLNRFLKSESGQTCHYIFTSLEADIDSRLKAVTAGGCAYFLKPVTFSHLIDRINSLTSKTTPEPYRVLIVDDSASLAQFISTLLQSSGMLTEVVTNPLDVLDPLYHFQPDILLMDIYMPQCSGTDLARVIRQDPKFVSVPIVYLSTEKDIDAQLLAMSQGADDFLTKPIVPEMLLNTMKIRCARARMIRDSIVRDSLTGLFNHSYFLDLLDREVVLAGRESDIFSVCMLDVDHFKNINDTYGHQCGDQVLKSLSTFLVNRLRKSDVVGRYGGEEFAVILPGCGPAHAREIMEEVREGFAKVLFQVGGESFHVSFSTGIATFTKGQIGDQVVEEADKALYRAKAEGRNCIVHTGDPE